MRSERDKIRSYSEEEQTMLNVVPQDFEQAVEISPNGFFESVFSVGFQSERLVAATWDAPVYARIANSHLRGSIICIHADVLFAGRQLTLGKRLL